MSKARALSFVEAAERHLAYLPGEVLVKFQPNTSSTQQQAALSVLRSRPSASDLEWIEPYALPPCIFVTAAVKLVMMNAA